MVFQNSLASIATIGMYQYDLYSLSNWVKDNYYMHKKQKLFILRSNDCECNNNACITAGYACVNGRCVPDIGSTFIFLFFCLIC